MLTYLRTRWLSWSYLLVVVTLIILSLYIPRDEQFEANAIVADPTGAILKIFDKITTLAASINTALAAAVVAIMFKSSDISIKRAPANALAVIVAFAACSISYFGIYLGYVRLITMLSVVDAPSIDLTETQMIWAVRMQFWGIVLEAAAIGFLLIQILEAKVDSAKH